MTEEAIQKRREREEKRAAAARAKALAEGLDPDGVSAETVAAPTAAQKERTGGGLPSTSDTPYTVPVHTASVGLEWYRPETAEYATIEEARTAGVWVYPSTAFERAKCAVFRDLWEKGHFMGGGIKFGGDFLVYPGVYTVL